MIETENTGLRSQPRLVAATLAQLADHDGIIRQSLAQLEREAVRRSGLTLGDIQKATAALSAAGWLKRHGPNAWRVANPNSAVVTTWPQPRSEPDSIIG